jgi:hypothetical protein
VLRRLQIAPSDSIVLAMAPKGKHMISNSQLPLVPPKANPEKIIKNGKASQKRFSAAATSASG